MVLLLQKNSPKAVLHIQKRPGKFVVVKWQMAKVARFFIQVRSHLDIVLTYIGNIEVAPGGSEFLPKVPYKIEIVKIKKFFLDKIVHTT